LRTFVAIELPPAAKQQVQARQRHLRQALDQEGLGDLFRWTHAENLHLTLRFLGATSEAQRREIEAALTAVAAAAPVFRLVVQKPGAFPNLRKPSIIWLDFGGDLSLLSPLQAQVERAAQAAGFAAEERAFAPHLTIARAQKSAAPAALARAGELLRAETAAPPADPAPFPVEQIHLIRSDLRPAGPVYRPLAVFDLRAQGRSSGV
jgi:2'-5' RNA ligase